MIRKFLPSLGALVGAASACKDRKSLSGAMGSACLISLMTLLNGCQTLREPGVYSMPAIQTVAADGSTAPASPWQFGPQVNTYRLGVGDIITIRYIYNPELSQDVVVAPDGTIAAPFLESQKAAGLTPDELKAELSQQYVELRTSMPPAEKRQYIIQQQDMLDIVSPSYPALNVSVLVRPDGYISLPLLSAPVVAVGITPETLRQRLVDAYRGRLQEPSDLTVILKEAKSPVFYAGDVRMQDPVPNIEKLSVSLKSYNPPRIFISGEVKQPGGSDLVAPITLMQAIQVAGGQLPSGDMEKVTILRRTQDNSAQYIVRDLAADLEGRGTNDILLQASDIVVVPRTDVAYTAEWINQHIYSIVPQMRNTGMNITYFPFPIPK